MWRGSSLKRIKVRDSLRWDHQYKKRFGRAEFGAGSWRWRVQNFSEQLSFERRQRLTTQKGPAQSVGIYNLVGITNTNSRLLKACCFFLNQALKRVRMFSFKISGFGKFLRTHLRKNLCFSICWAGLNRAEVVGIIIWKKSSHFVPLTDVDVT